MKKSNKDNTLFNSQYQAALKAVDAYFNDISKSIDWMYTRNPLLGNVVPKDMIEVGRYQKLINFIYTNLEENKR